MNISMKRIILIAISILPLFGFTQNEVILKSGITVVEKIEGFYGTHLVFNNEIPALASDRVEIFDVNAIKGPMPRSRMKAILKKNSEIIFFDESGNEIKDEKLIHKDKRELKIEEIYKQETLVISKRPFAEEFRELYEETLKNSIRNQLKDHWKDIVYAAGTGLAGDNVDRNDLRATRHESERKEIYESWLHEIKNRETSNPIPIPSTNEPIVSSGTGFAISQSGLIVTNDHVVKNAKTIIVKGINGHFNETLDAEVLISDENSDLAILKITDVSFTSLDTVPYTIKYTSSKVGEAVYVLGYPMTTTMGNEIKLTDGIISSKTGYKNDVKSYQISAPVQHGNSGGPVFDVDGKLIGVINAKHEGAENATYAIKSRYLFDLFDLIDLPIVLKNESSLSNKSLVEQVEKVKDYVFLIESTY